MSSNPPRLLPSQKAHMLRHLRNALQILEATPADTSCEACAEFLEGYCSKWKAAVPADAIPQGCPEFIEPIPF